MDLLQKLASGAKVPTNNDNVYKEECVFSFDNPETDTGLYVCLKTFLGFGKDYLVGYHKKTGNSLFLQIHRTKKLIVDQVQVGEGPEKKQKITRLAIGVEGGFDGDSKTYEYDEKYSIVALPDFVSVPYPSEGLPEQITNSVKAILEAESALVKREKEALTGTWDGEVRQVSQYALDLQQLDNGKKIPPTGWKCEKCDLTNNLWLNLTDGSILCGRKFFDGSGGNDHAVAHFLETGYPLAVKLGTITADGKADVYSYGEDDMVEDPNLKQHLAHFGINASQMEKTEKSMVELELDLNQRVGEWSLLTEANSNLKPIAGPGYTGMKNLGNSCYLNSVVQVVFTIPDFIKRFVEDAPNIFAAYPNDPANDFNVQMAKLGVGLHSGKYSSIAENSLDSEQNGIPPAMFKNLIGKNHPDFSTKHQQDAQEFFLHLITVLERNSRNQANPADALQFSIEDRFECGASGKVKYTYRNDWCLPLQIPLHLATNIGEVKEYEAKLAQAEQDGKKLDPDQLVRPRLTLKSCLDTFTQCEIVDQFFSSAINGQTTAKKTTRLATMPDFLMLHMKKFTMREDWTPIKLDVAVEIPDILDLSELRGTGLMANEESLPDLSGPAPAMPPMDANVLQQLCEMGFPPEACKRAIFFTKNSGLEPATQWIMEHITDSDFGDPFVPPGMDVKKSAFVPNPEGLEGLMGMGFTDQQATKALKATDNNLERAVDWIFSHTDELNAMDVGETEETGAAAAGSATNKPRDGGCNYKLVAFISHMGTSTQVGHYVCHILKDNQWVIFNDSKVAISQNPPKELGYLYLYQRL